MMRGSGESIFAINQGRKRTERLINVTAALGFGRTTACQGLAQQQLEIKSQRRKKKPGGLKNLILTACKKNMTKKIVTEKAYEKTEKKAKKHEKKMMCKRQWKKKKKRTKIKRTEKTNKQRRKTLDGKKGVGRKKKKEKGQKKKAGRKNKRKRVKQKEKRVKKYDGQKNHGSLTFFLLDIELRSPMVRRRCSSVHKSIFISQFIPSALLS